MGELGAEFRDVYCAAGELIITGKAIHSATPYDESLGMLA